MSTKILRIPAVQIKTGLARSTIYKHVKLGNFPPPIRLCGNAVGWENESIELWIQSRDVLTPKEGA